MKASINGIAIVGLKTWDTDDGGGYQGNLTLDGKKIGRFHNDGNGGNIDVHIDAPAQESFNQRIASYYKAYPSQYPTEDMFVEEMVNHTENLKFFKSGVKKGYTIFALLWKAPRTQTMIDDRYFNTTHQAMYVSEKGLLTAIVKEGFMDQQLFKSEEDFAINTDLAEAH